MKVYGLLIFVFAVSSLLYAPLELEEIPKLVAHTKNLIPVAIIGSGPAGLSAAIPPTRSGYHTVVFQGQKPGGELSEAQVVENWPAVGKGSGAAIMKKLEEQVRQFGAHLVPLLVTHVDFTKWPYTLSLNDGTTVQALTVICATGSTQRKLGIEGESTYWGKGLFSCGLCDGSYAHDKDTIVIGGGDIAIQRALQLAPEARSVTLIVPGPSMTAHETMQKKLKSLSNVKILLNKQVTQIVGNDTAVTHVKLYDPVTKKSSTYQTSSIFLSNVLTPNTELFQGILPCNQDGCLSLRPDTRSQQTSVEGVMAAGTISDPTYRQVAVIAGDGTKAGIDALACLSKWGFDGPLRKHLLKNLYTPPTIPHPLIKKLATLRAFKRAIRTSKPVLVEFYSPNCPSCRKMEGPLTTVTEQFKEKVGVYKVDRDVLYSLIEKYDIDFIPAFLTFINGKVVDRIEGETTLNKLSDLVSTTIAKKAPQKTLKSKEKKAHQDHQSATIRSTTT